MACIRHLLVLFGICSLVGLNSSGVYAQNGFLPPQQLPQVENANAGQQEFADQVSAMASNPVLWRQYQALQAPTASGGQACGCGGSPYDRCGCNQELFPWISGPGMCDSWCVGPKWAFQADGLFIFRDDADWDAIGAAVGQPEDYFDQFDHALGARLFATAYNDSGFGMQVGYEGVNDWHASASFPLAGATETFDYETRLNSVEINFLPNTPYVWKLFGGFRYVEISENFIEFTAFDKTVPPPVSSPGAPVVPANPDTGISHLLKNRLIGFQLGGRRDAWQIGRWVTLETFGNAGVYCNKFKRQNTNRTITTVYYADDLDTPDVNEFQELTQETVTSTRQDFAEVAFVGELGVSSLVRLNQCVALRSGYQLMVVDGMGQGLDAFFVPDFASSTVLYHGLQFGLEYRR